MSESISRVVSVTNGMCEGGLYIDGRLVCDAFKRGTTVSASEVLEALVEAGFLSTDTVPDLPFDGERYCEEMPDDEKSVLNGSIVRRPLPASLEELGSYRMS